MPINRTDTITDYHLFLGRNPMADFLFLKKQYRKLLNYNEDGCVKGYEAFDLLFTINAFNILQEIEVKESPDKYFLLRQAITLNLSWPMAVQVLRSKR